MTLLDSDHFSVLADPRHRRQAELRRRLRGSDDLIAIPIVAAEEQLRGWLAEIHRIRQPHKQIVPYVRLAKLIDFFSEWQIIHWNEPAADEFVKLREQRIRIGTQDLKIAAIALANDALLLSANLRDFNKVPLLRVEDWLRE
ncbi:MAG: type II toxin-antitoxin system VapC family toxin [Pirellulales bacterium]